MEKITITIELALPDGVLVPALLDGSKILVERLAWNEGLGGPVALEGPATDLYRFLLEAMEAQEAVDITMPK